MTTHDNSSGRATFQERLAEMGARATQTLADLMEQEPSTIDIADRVPYLPGMVLEALAGIKDQLNDESRVAIEVWQEGKRQRYREMHEAFERSERAFRASLPPNWHSPDIEFPSIEELEELQLTQGMPLAWVPPNRVLNALLNLQTADERNRLIEEESATILDACLDELEQLSEDLTSEWRKSAREAALSMQAEYWLAGQALAAIALDTATDEFVRSSYANATHHYDRQRKPTPPGSSPTSFPTWTDIDYPRALLVMYGIWGAFKQFWVNRGDLVPAQFSRHGTVHSMSSRQYTMANALVALMHLVALLCLLEEMIAESTSPANPSG